MVMSEKQMDVGFYWYSDGMSRWNCRVCSDWAKEGGGIETIRHHDTCGFRTLAQEVEDARDDYDAIREGVDALAHLETAKLTKAKAATKHLSDQIDRLAKVILQEFDGPTHDEGACDTAIRIMRKQQEALKKFVDWHESKEWTIGPCGNREEFLDNFYDIARKGGTMSDAAE